MQIKDLASLGSMEQGNITSGLWMNTITSSDWKLLTDEESNSLNAMDLNLETQECKRWR